MEIFQSRGLLLPSFFFNFCFFLFFFWLGPRFRFTASGDKSASEKCRRKKKVAFFWHPTCQKAKKKHEQKECSFFFLLVGDKNKFANRQIRTHAQQDNLSAEFLFSFIFRISGANPIISQRHCVLFIFFFEGMATMHRIWSALN